MRRAHLKFLPTLPAATFLLTSCSGGEVSGLGFEEGLSSVNDHSLSLWQGAWIAAGVVGVFTLILILWPVFFQLALQHCELQCEEVFYLPDLTRSQFQ